MPQFPLNYHPHTRWLWNYWTPSAGFSFGGPQATGFGVFLRAVYGVHTVFIMLQIVASTDATKALLKKIQKPLFSYCSVSTQYSITFKIWSHLLFLKKPHKMFISSNNTLTANVLIILWQYKCLKHFYFAQKYNDCLREKHCAFVWVDVAVGIVRNQMSFFFHGITL